jgi:hypothetical protein
MNPEEIMIDRDVIVYAQPDCPALPAAPRRHRAI